VLQHGGGGDESRFICGFLHSEQRFGPLLDAMPTLTCVRVRDGTIVLEAYTDTNRYADPVRLDEPPHWWQAAIAHVVSEATRSGPGNRAVLSRLSELLFMEVLRWQLTYISQGHSGWLAGLMDDHVGRALAVLHGDPARAWTVEDLATSAGISRAALAKKFADLIGETPMQYLAGWRMHLARRMLRESSIGIAELAARVGYESEAAFSRAFRPTVGIPLARCECSRTNRRAMTPEVRFWHGMPVRCAAAIPSGI
jgi:AraC-like DNA-binding protein